VMAGPTSCDRPTVVVRDGTLSGNSTDAVTP
jgi:hypothetical protein